MCSVDSGRTVERTSVCDVDRTIERDGEMNLKTQQHKKFDAESTKRNLSCACIGSHLFVYRLDKCTILEWKEVRFHIAVKPMIA